MINSIYWLLGIGKFEPLEFLAIFQKPSYLISVFFLVTVIVKCIIINKTNKNIIIYLCIMAYGVIYSMLIGLDTVTIARSLSIYLITFPIIYISFSGVGNINIKWPVLVPAIILISESIYYFISDQLIITTMVVPHTKRIPTGIYTEPAFACLSLIVLSIVIDGKFNKVFFFVASVIYSFIFNIETGLVMIFVLIFSRLIYGLYKKEGWLFNPYIVVLVLLLFYGVVGVYSNEMFGINQSALNRLTTPLYYIVTSLLDNPINIIIGNGIGSVIVDYSKVLGFGSSYFDIQLSIEQYRNTNELFDTNPAVFNFYARVIYELGIIGLLLYIYVLNKIFKHVADWQGFSLYLMSLMYLMSNDKFINILTLVLALYVFTSKKSSKEFN